MCGIAGYYSLNKKPVNKRYISKMLERIKHRGPDDRGIVFVDTANKSCDHTGNKNCYDGILGFNRLSIRDLSSNGHQPLICADGKVVLAFNGEIYNTEELCITALGLKKTIKCDTEVLKLLYLKYGIKKMLDLINGIYSIVIWDLREDSLYLIRDCFGVKPLYYSILNEEVIFCSEQKAIFEYGTFHNKINSKDISEIIMFRSPYQAELWEDIYSVAPGHYLKVINGKIEKYKYFDLDQFQRYSLSDISYQEGKEKLNGILKRVVERQLLSDRPIGVQLSGGVDSSLLSNYINMVNSNIEAFSIFINEPEYSEEKFIKQVIEKLNINCNNYLYTKNDASREIEKVSCVLDTVNTHFNALGLYHLASMAKNKVTVLLSGEGADELFGGYYQFAEGILVSKYVNGNSHCRKMDFNYFGEESRSYVMYAIRKDMQVSYDTYKKVINLDNDGYLEKRVRLFNSFNGDDYERHIRYEITGHLSDLLKKQDKVAMANGIENRVPFLDKEIVQFALTMPSEFFMNNRNGNYIGKYILKDLCAEKFDQSFAFRKKMGFPHPIKLYMTEFLKKTSVNSIIEQLREYNWINHTLVRSWFQNLNTLDNDQITVLWKLLHIAILTENYY
nr:asparagine synthase (glutamine-hydrolyzing) [uncultured Blautia sp.]